MRLGPGDLDVSPNPVQDGGTIQVSYSGPGAVTVGFDFGPTKPVSLDAAGNGKIKVPPGTRIVIVRSSDGSMIEVDVVGSRP